MDLFNGEVVHAIKGDRERYEPINQFSKIVATSDPLKIIDQVSPAAVYVADLNRITGRGDNLDLIRAIASRVPTMADTGISQASDMEAVPYGVVPVLGTETAPFEMMEWASSVSRAVVSLDMRAGEVLARDPGMKIPPLDLLRRLNSLEIEAVILLDLVRVGTSSGLDIDFLRKAVDVSKHPLILGGGVKGTGDLDVLEDLGFSGALVATAVHDGSIPLEIIRGRG